MMCECNVSLITQTEDGILKSSARGKLQTVSEGFLVSYLQDGDAVSVLANSRYFSMKRRGETSLEGYFSTEGGSRMVLFLGDSCGEIPVDTEEYLFRENGNGFSATLVYTLGKADELQRFHLKFNINKNLEEK